MCVVVSVRVSICRCGGCRGGIVKIGGMEWGSGANVEGYL